MVSDRLARLIVDGNVGPIRQQSDELRSRRWRGDRLGKAAKENPRTLQLLDPKRSACCGAERYVRMIRAGHDVGMMMVRRLPTCPSGVVRLSGRKLLAKNNMRLVFCFVFVPTCSKKKDAFNPFTQPYMHTCTTGFRRARCVRSGTGSRRERAFSFSRHCYNVLTITSTVS